MATNLEALEACGVSKPIAGLISKLMVPNEKPLSLGFATRSRLEKDADDFEVQFLAATIVELSDPPNPSSENITMFSVNLYYFTPTGEVAESSLLVDTDNPVEISLELFRALVTDKTKLKLEIVSGKIFPGPHLD